MKAIVLDSQLLVLFIVGKTRRGYIQAHKRLQDFDLLVEILSEASDVVVTPNALAEASNLLAYARNPMRMELFQAFAVLGPAFDERYIRSTDASCRDEFVRLGLTDAAMLEISRDDRVLLTADLDLYLAAVSAGLEAVNFNYEREARGTV